MLESSSFASPMETLRPIGVNPCNRLLLLPVGLILALAGAGTLLSNLAFLAGSQRAVGTVIGVETMSGKSAPHHPVIEFRAADGTPVRYLGKVGSETPPEVGSKRDVVYKKADPTVMRDGSASHGWIFPLVLTLLGLAAFRIGLQSWRRIRHGVRTVMETARSMSSRASDDGRPMTVVHLTDVAPRDADDEASRAKTDGDGNR